MSCAVGGLVVGGDECDVLVHRAGREGSLRPHRTDGSLKEMERRGNLARVVYILSTLGDTYSIQ